MSRFEVDWRGPTVLESRLPTGDTNTPTVARFQPWKAPLRHRSYEIVPIEDGEIEKFLRCPHADRVEANVFGAGAAIAIAIKSGHRIAAAAAQFGTEDISRHGEMVAQGIRTRHLNRTLWNRLRWITVRR